MEESLPNTTLSADGPTDVALVNSSDRRALIPEFVWAGQLAAAIRANPWWFRYAVRRGSPLQRRLRVTLFLAAAALIVSSILTGLGHTFAVTSLVLAIYLPLRLFLIYRSARGAVSVARRDLNAGLLPHLVLTGLTPAELSLGWAVAGFAGQIPVTLISFCALAPFAFVFGPVGAICLAVELVHVILFQFLAAIISSGLMVSYRYRHEAGSAGFMSAAFLYPTLFALQSMLLALPFVVLFVAIALQLGSTPPLDSSMPGLWVVLAAVGFVVVYWVWTPIATLKEFDHQFETILPADSELHRYLES